MDNIILLPKYQPRPNSQHYKRLYSLSNVQSQVASVVIYKDAIVGSTTQSFPEFLFYDAYFMTYRQESELQLYQCRCHT